MTITDIDIYNGQIQDLPVNKLLISTINAYSYLVAQKDKEFADALIHSDILLPDGVSMVFASWFLRGLKIKKIAGADLFLYEMDRLNKTEGKCFFLGSKEDTLRLIVNRLNREFPQVRVQTYSPPFKSMFSPEENRFMIDAVNSFMPDVLMIGMTAPKQEKWAYKHSEELQVGHICSIGAVFDFYAGTVKRAPEWMIMLGLEWLYRLIVEPRRMWRRYLIGNPKFMWVILMEKIHLRGSTSGD
jgi:N-acetylglucosaminyldiphosphoundecaprenol N-acetyl-beta-D-mannosaminyltransferase